MLVLTCSSAVTKETEMADEEEEKEMAADSDFKQEEVSLPSLKL
jgi:hypothetical protein